MKGFSQMSTMIYPKRYRRYPNGSILLFDLLDTRTSSKKDNAFSKKTEMLMFRLIYEILAGHLYVGEDPRDCAERELEEEIGYRTGSMELLTSIFTAPGFTDIVIHIHKVTALQEGQQRLDQDEVLEVLEWPIEKAIAEIKTGTIRDAKTMIGLQMMYLDKKV